MSIESRALAKIPGWILVVLALLWGFGLTVMTVLDALGIVKGQGVQINVGEPNPALNFVGLAAVLVYQGVIVLGGLAMARGDDESRGLQWAAAVMSVVPCCTPMVCAGMPFGIWAIVMLASTPAESAGADVEAFD